jgi:chorismate mutase
MTTSIFIVFVHSLMPSFWTDAIENGLNGELHQSGIRVERTESFHMSEDKKEEILDFLKKERPNYVVVTNDLKKEDYGLVREIHNLGIPLFFTGKKIPATPLEERQFSGVYGKENFKKSIETLESVTKKKLKTVGVVSSPSPLISILVKNVKRDLPNCEIKVIETKTFEDWAEAVDNLIHKEKVDVLIPFLPYGGTYKGKEAGPDVWHLYGAELEKRNKSTPTIAGGSLSTSGMPIMLAYAQVPSGLGHKLATLVFRHIAGAPMSALPFVNTTEFDFQVNVKEFKRMGYEVPEKFYSHATLINNPKNKLDKFRIQLDNINLSILNLVKKRQDLSIQIGRFKKDNDLPLVDEKREEVVISKMIKHAKGVGLDEEFSEELSKLLIKYSKKIQLKEGFKSDAVVPSVDYSTDTKTNFFSFLADYFFSFFQINSKSASVKENSK